LGEVEKLTEQEKQNSRRRTKMKELQTKEEWNPKVMMEDLQNTQKMCEALLQTPHYRKMGADGIFAITQKAKALKLNPLEALNGGMYHVNGKVEMSSNMMIQLIRQAGHSVTKAKDSDDTICILHGKRKDNGDTWCESFSIADAKRAGIYKNTWEKFPRNMLFARALSNLARQLFPDVVGGCYVEGEISQASPFSAQQEEVENLEEVEVVQEEIISTEQLAKLEILLSEDPEHRENVMTALRVHYKISDLSQIPVKVFEQICAKAKTRKENKAKEAKKKAAEVKEPKPEPVQIPMKELVELGF